MSSHVLYAGVLGVIVLSLARSFAFTPEADENQGRLPGRGAFPADFRADLYAFVVVDWFGITAGRSGECLQARLCRSLARGRRMGRAAAEIYFIAPRARQFAQFTIPDLLEARYNQTARVLGVIAILFAYTAITSYELIKQGAIFCT